MRALGTFRCWVVIRSVPGDDAGKPAKPLPGGYWLPFTCLSVGLICVRCEPGRRLARPPCALDPNGSP